MRLGEIMMLARPTSTAVVGGIEHIVVEGVVLPGEVVRFACGATYVVGAGRKWEPAGACQPCLEGP